MKARKFKIVMVSKHVYASWGKRITEKIMDELPKGAVILEQEGNFTKACLDMLVFHEKFPTVPLGQDIPRMNLDLPINTEDPKPKLIYNH